MFCRRFLDGSDPLGAVLWFGQDPLTIVGIVGDTRQSIDVAAVSQPNANAGTVYLSLTKYVRPPTWAFLVVRTSLLRADVGRDVIGEIESLDTTAFFGDPRRFTDLISTKTAGQRRLSVLLGVMACIVLLLTAVSLTAALSQLVTLRSREIAIRYCLGAGHRQIIGLTLKHVGAMLGTGLLLGVGGGLMLGRALANQLYGVTSTDVRTLVSVFPAAPRREHLRSRRAAATRLSHRPARHTSQRVTRGAMHLRDFRLTTCFLAAVSQRQTEASNFGPQQPATSSTARAASRAAVTMCGNILTRWASIGGAGTSSSRGKAITRRGMSTSTATAR